MKDQKVVRNDMNPLISVVMSVYNAEQFISETIESVLHQTYTNFEFIIIDDASTDDSNSIIRSYNDPRMRIHVNHENFGLTRSLNIGLNMASGEYIVRQDADDVSHITRFQKQLDFFRTNPYFDILGTQANYIYENGDNAKGFRIHKPLTKPAILFSLTYDSPFIHSTVMFKRKSVWGKLKGYDELFRTSQDLQLWSRASKELSLANMSEALLNFRIVKTSVSSNYKVADIHKLAPIYLSNCIQSGFNKQKAELFVSFLYRFIFRKPLDECRYEEIPKFLYWHIRKIAVNKSGNEQSNLDKYFYVQTLLFFSINTFSKAKNLSFQFLFFAFLLNPFIFFTILIKEFVKRFID